MKKAVVTPLATCMTAQITAVSDSETELTDLLCPAIIGIGVKLVEKQFLHLERA